MDTLWIIALIANGGYVISLIVHPYTACRACRRTPGRHHGAIFTYAHRKCAKCRGKGRQLRLGARLILGRTDTT